MNVTKKQLADLLGITTTEIDNRVQRSFFPSPVKSKYNLAECAARYASELRDFAAGRQAKTSTPGADDGEDAAEWAAALREEQSIDARTRREILEGKLVPRNEVDKGLGGVIVQARNEIQDAPQRMRHTLFNMSDTTRNFLKQQSRDCLDKLVMDGLRAFDLVKKRADSESP